MGKRFYVTTPIYYVNDVPHIGHAYTTVAADVVARFRRLSGEDVFFLTGTDEHGQKIERAAEASGITPIELADRVVVRFKNLWERLDITNDDFIRTSEDRHKRAVQEIFRMIQDRGDIYLGEYEGWYDVRNETFVTETQLEEYMNLPESTRPPLERIKEESYFFRLSTYQDKLIEHYRKHPEFIQPENRRNEVIRFVEGGLKDLSVSRTTFSWGIPVPEDSKHVIYVWFDALTNYLTAAGFPYDSEKMNEIWPADIHLVGKDILRFHAVYWPAFLMSAGLPLPRQVLAHGWWTVEGAKMSKSLGNVVDPYMVVEEFGQDAFRYFLLREIPFGQDGDFSRSAIIGRINGELANGLGNLVSRTIGMIKKYNRGVIPTPGPFLKADLNIKEGAIETVNEFEKYMDEIAFSRSLSKLWNYIGIVNRYIDESSPWSLAKSGETERLNTVLWVLTESIRIVAILVYPFMPASATEIWGMLGYGDRLDSARISDAREWGGSSPGSSVGVVRSVFPRYDSK